MVFKYKPIEIEIIDYLSKQKCNPFFFLCTHRVSKIPLRLFLFRSFVFPTLIHFKYLWARLALFYLIDEFASDKGVKVGSAFGGLNRYFPIYEVGRLWTVLQLAVCFRRCQSKAKETRPAVPTNCGWRQANKQNQNPQSPPFRDLLACKWFSPGNVHVKSSEFPKRRCGKAQVTLGNM